MRASPLRRVFLIGLGLFYLLHNDLWLWNDPRLVAGLPIGLTYHLAYCLAAAALMALLLAIDPAPEPPRPPLRTGSTGDASTAGNGPAR